MALFDFSNGWDPESTYDIVVVGGGAAGLYLASKVSRSRRVLVLETGHFEEDEDRQRLNEVVHAGKPMQAAVWGRKRAVGGTTIAWGGQSLPFSAMDFDVRPWVHASGWPIEYATLEPHYGAANQAIGVDDGDYRHGAFEHISYTPPPFDARLVDVHVSKWAPEPNFRKVFASETSRSFDVLYNAHVTRLNFGDSQVESVEVSGFDGNKVTIGTPSLVLAGGGLETVRTLLLVSARERVFSDAQRNRLGRGFMDHPCVDAGFVDTDRPYGLQRAFSTQLANRRKYSIRLSVAGPLAREARLLNVSASLLFVPPGDEFDPYSEYRDFGRLLGRPANFLATSGAFARTAVALARDRFVYKHRARARLTLMCEQEPLDESRLTLHPTRKDRFGAPLLTVDWRVSSKTWETARAFSRVIRDEFARLGLGQVRLRPEMGEGTGDRTDLLSDVNHHMGGAAMGADPSRSVVAPDLSVRGVPNLFVCSTASYPTGSHSNPTLTLLALTDRLAVHLRRTSRT